MGRPGKESHGYFRFIATDCSLSGLRPQEKCTRDREKDLGSGEWGWDWEGTVGEKCVGAGEVVVEGN